MCVDMEQNNWQQPRDDCLANRTARTFHLFPRLPAEIRIAIWQHFRLRCAKRGPRIHLLWELWEITDETWFSYDRKYTQVNRESRHEVLGGREVHIMRWATGDVARLLLVDWDKDLFHVHIGSSTSPSESHGIHEDTLKKIKNVAWTLPINPTLSNMDHQWFAKAFASVKRVIFAVQASGVPYILRLESFADVPCYTFAIRNGGSEYELYPDSPVLPLNEYGYHTFEPDVYPYDHWCIPKPISETGPPVPFTERVDSVIREATSETFPKLLGRKVEFRIMLKKCEYRAPPAWW